MGETKPLESFNKSIEIVERNQWNRWTNPMDSFTKTGGLPFRNGQYRGESLAICLRRYTNTHE